MATIGFLPVQDTYISEYYPNQNFSNSPSLFIGQFQVKKDTYRSLLQFNLCSRICNYIPPEKTIQSAYLRLYIYRNEIPSATSVIYVYRLLEEFNEKTVTWNTQPQFYGIYSGYAALSVGITGFFNIDITDLVRGWYKGLIEQHGIVVRGGEGDNNVVGFRGLDYWDSTFWPRLIVEYA